MEPVNDPQLSELLKEWQVSGAPPSLDARVFGKPKDGGTFCSPGRFGCRCRWGWPSLPFYS